MTIASCPNGCSHLTPYLSISFLYHENDVISGGNATAIPPTQLWATLPSHSPPCYIHFKPFLIHPPALKALWIPSRSNLFLFACLIQFYHIIIYCYYAHNIYFFSQKIPVIIFRQIGLWARRSQLAKPESRVCFRKWNILLVNVGISIQFFSRLFETVE